MYSEHGMYKRNGNERVFSQDLSSSTLFVTAFRAFQALAFPHILEVHGGGVRVYGDTRISMGTHGSGTMTHMQVMDKHKRHLSAGLKRSVRLSQRRSQDTRAFALYMSIGANLKEKKS